ncbi:15289_t:CDS:10, partial [Racocetra fulgida]
IQDEYGDTLYNLALNDIKNFTLLEQLGLERVLWSLVLQRQEEVDIFFADSTKKYIAPDLVTYDIAAFDIFRSRDRGVDSVEAWVGVMSEDHLDGSNVGKGFGPEDNGMKGAEFIIGRVINGNVTLENYYADVGGYHPPFRDFHQDPDLVPKFSMSDSKAVTVEFKRLLRPPRRKPITNDNMKFVKQKIMMHTHIDYEDYAKLPEFTWEEINECVQQALLIPEDKLSEKFSSVLAKHISHLQGVPIPQKLSTVSRLIDNLNKMYYLKAPLAQHAHSRFAAQKMASMVIGKVVEKEPLVQNDYITFSKIQESERSFVDYNRTFSSTIKNIQFHRYKLTSKVMVNANVKYPVIKFTFSRVHQERKNVSNQKFLPGHYIEMQSRLIGYEIQVRGPFDICNRPRSKPYLISPISPLTSTQYFNWEASLYSPTSPYNKLIGSPGTLSPMKTFLLNPNSSDGCWDELYMIAGGTGITPMLQLIKYHLEQSAKRNNDSKQNVNFKRMHLLFGNRKIEDIIDGILLEDLALSSRGQLTVTYCLSDPPSDWVGFQGRIGPQVIQNWMNIVRGSDYTHIQDHYIPYNSDEHNESSSPEISSRLQSSREISQTLPVLPYGTADIQSSAIESKSRKINSSTERIPEKINLDLVASMKWDNLMG